MALKLAGFGGTVADVMGTAFRGLKTNAMPIDPGTNGAYRLSLVTGTLPAALAANAEIFQFRWSHASKLAVITKLKIRFLPLTAFTAAILTDHTSFDAYLATGWSAQGTLGTAITAPSKMRQSMPVSTFTAGDIRIAAAAALGGGTKTIDANSIGASLRKGNRVNPAAATEEVIQPSADGMDLDINMADGDYPIVLGGASGGANSHGLIVRNRTVWPAAGTGIIVVTIAWTEVDTF